jgi:hypothetical protein
MLTQLFPFLDPTYITPDLACRLRALADDCDRLARSRTISSLVLRSSPLLKDWMLARTPEGLHIVGNASGDPVHGDRRVLTTQLWFADLTAAGSERFPDSIGLGRLPTPRTVTAFSVLEPVTVKPVARRMRDECRDERR